MVVLLVAAEVVVVVAVGSSPPLGVDEELQPVVTRISEARMPV